MPLLCIPKFATHFPKPALPVIDKQEQRRISTELEAYIARKRVYPKPLTTRININKDADEAAATVRVSNLICILVRQLNMENATISIGSDST